MSNTIGNSGIHAKYHADIDGKSGRDLKETDVLVFSRIGFSAGSPLDKALLFKGVGDHSPLKKIRNFLMGRHKATEQDVLTMFKTNGMTNQQAKAALEFVKKKSENLSGFSAKAVSDQIHANRP